MSNQRFSPEYKDESVRQITERGYSVADVAQRPGVSGHSLYKWVKSATPDKTAQHSLELIDTKNGVLKLRAQLRRTEEERDIDRKTAAMSGCASAANIIWSRA